MSNYRRWLFTVGYSNLQLASSQGSRLVSKMIYGQLYDSSRPTGQFGIPFPESK